MSDEAAPIPNTGLLKALLSDFGLSRVVYVDDIFSDETQQENLRLQCVHKLTAIGTEGAEQHLGQLDLVETSEEPDELKDAVESVLEGYDRRQLLDLAIACSVHLPGISTADIDTGATVDAFIDCDLRMLSLKAWNESANELIKDHNDGTNTLFLFDLNLSAEGGSKSEGIKLIQRAIEAAPNATFGILSRTAGIDDEDASWEELSTSSELPKNDFLFVSKERVTEGEISLASRLRPLLAAPAYRQVQERVRAAISNSMDAALTRVQELDVLDFEQIVFRSSVVEGAWEPDTLVRLFGVYQRHAFKKSAISDPELKDALMRLSRVVPTEPEEEWRAKIRDGAFRVQHDEIYWPGEAVNGFYEPIELGDIFDVSANGEHRQYILLQQPCDLAVRRFGERESGTVELTLVPIKEKAPEDFTPTDREKRVELPFFKQQEDMVSFLDLNAARHVRDWVIDACAYNDDGASRIDTGSQAIGVETIGSWRRRYPLVVKKGKQYARLFGDVIGKLKTDLHSSALSVSNSLWLEPALDAKVLTFKIARSGRVSREHALGLLAKYAQYHARSAYDHYFT